ncbi:MAG TPA: zinc ribbon domain-containing protein, partial [Dehalococcoidia bacterium]|nr:zinc ribbon domain-containing protein [Dehalococcoidia bacterium]
MEPFSGTSLTDHALTTGEVLSSEWHVKSEYSWDAGLAIGTFLEGLKQGKILGMKCPECRRIVVPPRAFCELCFRPINDWMELPDTGK